MSDHPALPADLIGYDALIEEAARGVIPLILKRFVPAPPGDHHLYVTFRTDRLDVSLPDWLREMYPTEMTVVLQHRYWELEAGPSAMAVKMQFRGVLAAMLVPYGAITRLYDPTVQTLFQFEPVDQELAQRQSVAEAIKEAMLGPDKAPEPMTPEAAADAVVDFAAFRGRKEKP